MDKQEDQLTSIKRYDNKNLKVLNRNLTNLRFAEYIVLIADNLDQIRNMLNRPPKGNRTGWFKNKLDEYKINDT